MLKDNVYLVTLRIRLTPLQDLVLPPLPSKLVKAVILAHGGPLARLLARRGFKPLRIAMPRLNGKPLYQTTDRRDLLMARKGEAMETSITAALPEEEAAELAWNPPDGVYETPYSGAKVQVETLEASMETIDSISLGGPGRTLRLDFQTTTLLTNRVLLPGEAPAPRMHRLYPSPGLLAAYTLRLWNRVSPRKIYIIDGWSQDAAMLARIAEVYMAELDHQIKPETVVIGRDSRGRLRTARGFRGWILYRVASKKLAKILDKTIALATRLGIGRSRALGLGELQAQWTNQKQPQ